MSVTIWHNPACGTSRNTLGLIRNSGEQPVVVEYLRTPPTRNELVAAIRTAGLTVREALRRKGTPYDALGLDDAALADLAACSVRGSTAPGDVQRRLLDGVADWLAASGAEDPVPRDR